MGLRLGQTAPDSTTESTQEATHLQQRSDNHRVDFFLYSKELTPACATAQAECAHRKAEFERCNACLPGLSVVSITDKDSKERYPAACSTLKAYLRFSLADQV